MLNIIESGGSDFEPNSKSDYSNSNYVLLSFILEKIYKKQYAEILNDEIVKPLNFKNTFFAKQINEKNNESFSYAFTNSWEKQSETDPSIPIGAGAIVSTPNDLTGFLYQLFNGNLLSKNSLKLMTTITNNFGYGFKEIPFENKLIYGHTGKIDEFTSEIGYIPTDKISFAITSNGLNYNLNDISSTVLKAVFDEPFEIPTFTTIDLSSNELEKFLGDYSSEDIPLKINIKKIGDKLIANNGKSDLELSTVSKNSFRYDPKGILFVFPSVNSMIFSQNGMTFKFTKK